MQRGSDSFRFRSLFSFTRSMRLKICLRPLSCRAITTLRLVGRWCCSCEMARGHHVFHCPLVRFRCQGLFSNDCQRRSTLRTELVRGLIYLATSHTFWLSVYRYRYLNCHPSNFTAKLKDNDSAVRFKRKS